MGPMAEPETPGAVASAVGAATGGAVGARGGEDDRDVLYLGDAIHFFLSAKRAGGRSDKTVDDYRKKLELFQRWLALRLGGEDEVDAPYI